MSQNSHHGDAAYPPDQAPDAVDAIDGSDAIFTLYLEIFLREDEKMIEVWNQDAKSILLFSGLFSATVAAALGPTLPDLSTSSEFQSSVYLQYIYDQLASANGSQPDTINFWPASTFQIVNSFWFLSLVISLTCALLAISLQQWTHRYFMEVRRRGTPCNQARIHEHLANGLRESRIVVLVDIMRACHQLSFVLFAMGLCAYFYSTDYVTFGIILFWFALWAGLYLWMTSTAISRNDSPYRSPLSSVFYRVVQLIRLAQTKIPDSTEIAASIPSRVSLKKLSPEGMREAIEDSVQILSKGLDSRILKLTFNSLNQDHEFERFFAGIPDFCDSRTVNDPKAGLLELNNEQKLSWTLFGWMHRTMRSHLISELARPQRIKICTMVIDAVPTIVSLSTLHRVFNTWEGLLGSVDFGSAVLRAVGNSDDPCTAFCARCIVAIVIARAQVHDRHSFNLTVQFLTSDMEVWVGISSTLWKYLEHVPSAMLANLIFVARIIFRFHSEHSRDKLFDVSSRTLRELSSNIDVRLATLEMQHEFCGLWNELVLQAQEQPQVQNGTGSYEPKISTYILRHLRKSYIALHESTDASLFYTSTDDNVLASLPGSSYPLCNIQDHRHTSPQTPHLTTASLTNPPSLHPPLSGPPNSIPRNVAVGATEVAIDGSNISPRPEAVPDLAVALSAPTSPHPPLATRLSVEIMPAVQESQGQNGTPPSVVVDSQPLSSLDQSEHTFPNPESPSLAPDAGQSLPTLHHEGDGGC